MKPFKPHRSPALLAVLCLWCGIASTVLAGKSGDEIGVISIQELPLQALATLTLIQRGGPFPFAKDGSIFSNRERRLPTMPRGYYHEYTVITPTARDRGARRVIAGGSREYYYTDDHYRSFRRISEAPP